MKKKSNPLYVVLIIWLIVFLFNIALWGGLIWAGIHFIHKFW